MKWYDCLLLSIAKTGKNNWAAKILLHILVKSQGGARLSSSLRIFYQTKYKVEVGKYSYGACFTNGFNRGGTVKIGNYCSFSNDVIYFGANHPLQNISTSAEFYNTTHQDIKFPDVKRYTLVIGNDVWIGHSVIITCGCTKIGNGACIGAGSVVTHDVPAYSIVAGNPAKIIRFRFTKEEIQKLESSHWWDLNVDLISQYYNNKIEEFCQLIEIYKKEHSGL